MCWPSTADQLGLAVNSSDRLLALAPITSEELLESLQRGEPEFGRLVGQQGVEPIGGGAAPAPPPLDCLSVGCRNWQGRASTGCVMERDAAWAAADHLVDVFRHWDLAG